MNKLFFVTTIGIFLFTCSYVMYKKPEPTLIIGFCGDVMLGRLVNEILEVKEYEYPWGNTLPLLHSLDLRIINLETTLTNHTEKNPKVFNFSAFPDRVAVLTKAHIDVASLANNHSLDFKEQGLIETMQTLDTAHIKHVGAGINSNEACKPVIITKNNITIGILGYTDNEPTWKAGSNTIGTNYIQIGNNHHLEKVKKEIALLRSRVDIIIITIHWGPNMKQRPSEEFINWAHEIIDAGVDIIHGHSAHVFQGIELYKNKIIMYDTGDFIDDYAIDPILRNDQSFLFTITVTKNGPENIKLSPVIISNMQVNKATGLEKDIIIKKMQNLSEELNTELNRDHFL